MSQVIDRSALLEQARQGVSVALAAGADQAEVYASSSFEHRANIQKNDLDQIRQSRETTFGIRVFCGGRLGFATSNNPSALKAIAEEAIAVADASPADPLNGLPEPSSIPEVSDSVDGEIVQLPSAQLAQRAMALLSRARKDSRVTIDSAGVEVGEVTRAVASSTGVGASWHSAAASGDVFGMAVEGSKVGSFSYDGDCVRSLGELNASIEGLVDRFAQNCIDALHPEKGESFRGSVLLTPHSLESVLVGPLVQVLRADEVRRGRSPLADRLGDTIASPLFTLTSLRGLENFSMVPFDREGQPRHDQVLVGDGVLKRFLWDSYESRASGGTLTGDAVGGAASLPSIGASVLSLAPGKTQLEDIKNMDRGIIVTRFSGSTDPISGDFSGVVKGGFLVKNGQPRPVHEITIAGNLWDCLKNISAVSVQRHQFSGVRSYPWVKVEDLSVTSG